MSPEAIITLLSFMAAFFAIMAINFVITDLYERDRRRMIHRMDEELRERQRERARDSVEKQGNQDLGNLVDEALRESNAERRSLLERFEEMIQQSGVRVTSTRLQVTSLLTGAVVALIVGFLSRNLFATLAFSVLAAIVPVLYIEMQRRRRMERLRSQLPDSLDLMARILRAGQTVTQAMQSVATEFKAPVGTEFGYCYEQQNLGLAPELALRDLAKRTGLLEIKILVLSLLVHRQAGGNMADLLDKLSNLVRERFRLRGQIKALTAEGRLQAIMLLALPPGLFAMLMIINRTYAVKIFDHPTMVIGTLVSMAVGALLIRKIVNFDF